MPARRLPVRPDLRQLKRQAKDLLKSIRRGDADALEELRTSHPHPPAAGDAQLADAQLVLARSYQATSWPRLVRACEMIDAIWRDDVDLVVRIVTAHPEMIHEHATIRDSNWGPPMAYAANLGRDRIVRMLHRLGATDTEWALGRAVLQGKIATARLLHEMLGSPEPPDGALAGPAYTLSVSGTAFAFEVGARIRANRADAEPLVPRVMAHLAPMVTALPRARPQRPFRAGNFDAVTLMGAPRALRDSVGEEYHHGAALTGFAYDLNGDGTDDYLVKGTMCGTGGCPYRIVDGASLRGVGLVFGYPLIVRARSTRGWPDIDVYSHGSATSGSYTSLEFDGASYTARETRQLAGAGVVDLFASFELIPWFRPGR